MDVDPLVEQGAVEVSTPGDRSLGATTNPLPGPSAVVTTFVDAAKNTAEM
jgi:hypothetical protein